MMQSPIPNAFWANMFKITAATTAALCLTSLYREKFNAGVQPIREHLAVLRRRELDFEEAAHAIDDISAAIDADSRLKKASIKLALRRRSNAALLVKLLHYDEKASEESTRLCRSVLNLVSKAFASDPAGRDAWSDAGGHKKLLALVASAHKDSNAALLDAAAHALHEVAAVDENEMQLKFDVPEGSKGAIALCSFPATVKMLRILDKSARTSFLVHATAVFASLCTLQPGGKAIAKGVDGQSGVKYFLDLIDPRGNQMLTEHCMHAIHWISIHEKTVHPELCEVENVRKIVDLLEPMQTTPTLHSAIGLIASLAHHGSASTFLQEFMAANGISGLIRLWCKSDERETRDRAETMVRILMTKDQCRDEVHRLLDMHRSMLMERRARDEEAMRKAQMQRQQQQMMQQQMMMQMMQSGQMPGGDDE